MDKTIVIRCNKCGQTLRVPGDKGSLKVVCPKCKSTFLYKPETVKKTADAVDRTSFRDELKNMKEPAKPKYYSDEQVYRMMIQDMYEHCIKDSIRYQYSKNRTGLVEIKFRFDSYHKEFNREDDISGYRKDSDIYNFSIDDYEGWSAGLSFKPLHKMEVSGGLVSATRKRFVLTPLGQRVYDDLKRMAAADGIVVHEPVGYYSTDYNSFGSRKRYTCNPKLNEYFYGKDPSHFTHLSSNYLEISASIRL